MGQLPAGISPFAYYDCAGNVWELTSSVYGQEPGVSDVRQHSGDRHYIVKREAPLPILLHVAVRVDGTTTMRTPGLHYGVFGLPQTYPEERLW